MCRSARRSSRRGGSTCWRPPRPPAGATRRSSMKRWNRSMPDSSVRAIWSASGSTPAVPCAATRSAGWRASVAPTSSSAAFTPHCTRPRPAPSGARTPWSAATAMSSGRRSSTIAPPAPRARCTRPDESAATTSAPRGGISCRPAATCGPRSRRSAGARRAARSARSGAPTAGCRGSRRPWRWSARRSSCAGAGSASSRSPTTTSTP